MYKIAVMGDKESIYGFAALGLNIYPTSEPDEAKRLIKKLSDGGYGIIYITEELAAKIPEEVEKFRYVGKPAIILIPGVHGNTGAGLADVTKSVEKAVGSNILK